MTSMQPLMSGASSLEMGTQQLQSFSPVMSLNQSLSSPGNSPKQVQDATAVMSPQQGQAPPTPTLSKAQEVVNSDHLMTPQRSQGPTGGMTSPQQFQDYAQGMASPPQFQNYAQGLASPQQFQGCDQGMVASQQLQGRNQDMSNPQHQLWSPDSGDDVQHAN